MLLAKPAGIAVAEMNESWSLDALKATVESARAVGENFFVVTRHRGLVDLQNIAAGYLKFEQLRIEGGGDIHS